MAEAGLDPHARSLITPEGVDLHVRLASVGERMVALLIDLAIMLGVVIAVLWAALSAFSQLHFGDRNGQTAAQIVGIVWLLFFFLLRNFYFTLMECSPRGATWGKRIMGLRVAARDGSALSADAVVARNAMREIELYLPVIVIFASMFASSGVEGWMALCALAWSATFLLFPVFNRDKLRAGDLVAGTWVVKTPKQKLLPDLASEKKHDPRFAFTEQQLSLYGVKELQVLESVLRTANTEIMAAVADRIRSKIQWRRGGDESDLDFLNAYYAGLRERLERKLLFGVRKRDKFDQS